MTPEQRKLARHALGLPNEQKKTYRNRYMAAIGSRQQKEWLDLVERGLAFGGMPSITSQGFCLSHEGMKAALDAGETFDLEDFPND